MRGWPRRRGRLSPRERLRTSAGAALGAVAGARGAVLSRGGPAPAPFTLDDTAGEAPPPTVNGTMKGGVTCSVIFVVMNAENFLVNLLRALRCSNKH